MLHITYNIEELRNDIEFDRFALAKWSPTASEINRDDFVLVCSVQRYKQKKYLPNFFRNPEDTPKLINYAM